MKCKDIYFHQLDGFEGEVSGKFENPFRYMPSEAVKFAASKVMEYIKMTRYITRRSDIHEGKMLGVLIAEDSEGNKGFFAAFSGNIDGNTRLSYFVPPIFDQNDLGNGFRRKECEITDLNMAIDVLENGFAYNYIKETLVREEAKYAADAKDFREYMKESKRHRDSLRNCNLTAEMEEKLLNESRFLKAEYARMKRFHKRNLDQLKMNKDDIETTLADMKGLRQTKSEELQKWLFENYRVRNILGEEASVSEIFSAQGIVPPAGTGECAAPKLLNYAFKKGYRPLSMGEFWFGKSPKNEIRSSGTFYPSCNSKCRPLFKFMLKGMDVYEYEVVPASESAVLYQDDAIVVAYKESGMPSVPGKDGRRSLEECLKESLGIELYPVHRLDMDTDGLIVFAKTADAQKYLGKEFEDRRVIKVYHALLPYNPDNPKHVAGSKGTINLPLIADIDDRPRQKVDLENGKESITEYEITEIVDDVMKVTFKPLTGRTHQLRLHSAHSDGLGAPIIGDLLYGGAPEGGRLRLTAFSITFTHPQTGKQVTFELQPSFLP